VKPQIAALYMTAKQSIVFRSVPAYDYQPFAAPERKAGPFFILRGRGMGFRRACF